MIVLSHLSALKTTLSLARIDGYKTELWEINFVNSPKIKNDYGQNLI